MQIGKRVRNCDKFGAQVHLMHMGKSHSGTIGGGVISLLFGGLILAYLSMRTIAVTAHKDPAISIYTVYEDREKMDAPINLAEYGQHLAFGFFDLQGIPQALDPRIGTFWFKKYYVNTSLEGTTYHDNVKIPIEGMHQSQNEALIQLLNSRFSKENLQGLYTAVDPSMLSLSGTELTKSRSTI